METLYQQLVAIARQRTHPFCLGCYERAPSGRCATCGSDDLGVELPGSGVDWTCDWVVREILTGHLEPADLTQAVEQFVADCWGETVPVAWITFDTATAVCDLDPLSWKMAIDDFADGECDAGNLCTFDGGNSYYCVRDVEQFINAN